MKPGVEFVGVVGIGGEKFDDGTEGAFRGEQRPGRGLDGAFGGRLPVFPAVAVILVEDFLDAVEVFVDVGDEDGTVEHVIAEALGDFGLAAAGDGAGLVTEGAVGRGADDAPGGRARVLFDMDLVAGGRHVDVFRGERDGDFLVTFLPENFEAFEGGAGVVGDVNEVGELFVDAVAFGLHVHHRGVIAHDVGPHAVVGGGGVLHELVAEIPGGKRDRSAGVLFLDVAQKIGGEGDLRFDFLLAVAVIVVGNQRDDDAFAGAAGELERHAVVVLVGLGFPAHRIAALTFVGILVPRQAERFLRELGEVRGEDDATGVAGPMFDIETGVIFWQKWIAGVAEDRFDEIEVGDQRARGKEADFHRLFGADAGDFRADDRARSSRETKVSAGVGWLAVKGRRA